MDKKFWKAATTRAIKTMAQVAGSMLVIGAWNETSWSLLVQTSVVAGVASILTSIAAGLPETEVCEND